MSRRGVPRCLILCPPWPQSGSANLFAAQTRAYLSMGFDVALVVLPHDASHGPEQRGFWSRVASELRFDPRQRVFLNRLDPSGPGAPARRRGRESSVLGLEADVAARSRLAVGLAGRIDRAGVDVIHVNHCFNMGAAARIAARSTAAGHGRPAILLETQDVQADRYLDCEIPNPDRRRIDPREHLARDELALCEGADVLLHLTESDLEYFRAALPGEQHRLVRPTLGNEPGASDTTGSEAARERTVDFLYVGDGHRANARSIAWFLAHVMGRLDPAVRVRIVGGVADRVRAEDPRLHAAHPGVWSGRCADVREAYDTARFVIVPLRGGTGVPMKLIEALAMGKRVVTSSAVLPAFREIDGLHRAVELADAPEDFARAMGRLAAGRDEHDDAGRALYARYFSNAVHREALSEIVAEQSARREPHGR